MLVTRPAPEAEVIRIISAAVTGGVEWVLLRERHTDVERVRRLLPPLRETIGGRATLILNHPGWRQFTSEVNGVHVPEKDLMIGRPAPDLPPDLWAGSSVHRMDSASLAAGLGYDYLIAGSIYETASHPGHAPAGVGFLREVAGAVPIPVVAIGGITPENAGECVAAGARGVAVLSGIWDAPDPQEAARAYRRALGGSDGPL